jgi:hypothetical protein
MRLKAAFVDLLHAPLRSDIGAGGARRNGGVVLAFIMALFAGPPYCWRPDIDASDPFVFSTLFADGGH